MRLHPPATVGAARFRTGRRIALGACAAVLSIGARPGAASPSITAGMPSEVRSWRVEILPASDYARLAGEWRAYSEGHPDCAVARVEQARALRYEGRAPLEERLALLRRALEIDPDCPEALDAAAGTWLGTPEPIVSSIDEAIRLGARATELAPDWTEPHFTLWSHCVLAGRTDEADAHLLALARKRAFPAPLVDFGYNLLASAGDGAVVFTNGDNDTYPPLALQALRGFRQDVAIVNLSLLNVAEYARQVWARAFPESPPFSANELDALLAGTTRPGPRIVEALARKVRDGSWTRPVSFALTVADPHLACCRGSLRVEGLLWNLLPAAVPDAGDEPPIDLEKTLRLFRNEFRLDSATDPVHPWGPTDAVTQILGNYPAVLRVAATRSATLGRVEDVRFAMRTALPLLQAQGKDEEVTTFARYWKELEPENPEVDGWL